MLMGEVSEEEANQILEDIMMEEEKQEEEKEQLDSPRGSDPVQRVPSVCYKYTGLSTTTESFCFTFTDI